MSSFVQLTFLGSTRMGEPGSVEAVMNAMREQSLTIGSIRVGQYTSTVHAHWSSYDQISPECLEFAYRHRNLSFHFNEHPWDAERGVISGSVEVDWSDDQTPPTKVPIAGLRLTLRGAGIFTQPKYGAEDNCDRLLCIAKRLYAAYQPQFGWIERGVLRGYTTQGALDALTIPHIYWANFFSPHYVEKYGKSFFDKAPGWRREHLNDGGCMYVLFPDMNRSRSGAKAIERAVKTYFGVEAVGKKNINRKKQKTASSSAAKPTARYPDLDEKIERKMKDGTLSEEDVVAYIVEVITRAEKEQEIIKKAGLN